MELLFATGNARKIREAQAVFDKYGIRLTAVEPDIHEIQHKDGREVTKAKAKAAHEKLQKPLFVQDTNWEIPALSGFPGAYMKDVTAWFTDDDWLHLMQRHDDRRAFVHEFVVYYDGREMQEFTASFAGEFVLTSKGTGAFSIERVIALEGEDTTIADRKDRGLLPQQQTMLEHLTGLAEWYSQQ